LETTQLRILDRFFRPTADGFEVIPEIRRMVHFSWDDLTSRHSLAPADSVFGSFDLVLCRNVLIYFSLGLQKRVQDKLYGALNPGGYLVLGTSESLPPEMAPWLIAVDQPHRIFQKPG
jgi:chemotaxis methyl-accepting protein methylase